MADNNASSVTENEIKQIISDHKVFWTNSNIELMVDGNRRIVGVSLILAGTESEQGLISDNKTASTLIDKLVVVAKWIIPEETPNVRIDIQRGDNYVFYRTDESDLNRKRYAIAMRIRHSGKFNEPYDEYQREIYNYLQGKLKEIGCPKEHWK
jgi:hypothetical protein